MMERKGEQMRIGYLSVPHHARKNVEWTGGERYPVLPEVMLP